MWGWDEAYLGADTDDPVALAEHVRTVVAAETGLSCSVGISDNKQRAKVATGFGKPAGVFTLTDADWMDVMGGRPVDALWGVGPKTAKKLDALGITTVRELAYSDAELLTSTFGPRTGLWILLLAKGGGDAEVSSQPWVPRSRSHVVTFPRDLTDGDEMRSAVTELAQRALAEIVEQDRIVTRVAVTVRTATFYTRTKIRKLGQPERRPHGDHRRRAGGVRAVRTRPAGPAAGCPAGTGDAGLTSAPPDPDEIASDRHDGAPSGRPASRCRIPPATAIRTVLTPRASGSPMWAAVPSRISWYSPSPGGFHTSARPGWATRLARLPAPTSITRDSLSTPTTAVTTCGRRDSATVMTVARGPKSATARRTSSNAAAWAIATSSPNVRATASGR